MPWRPKGWENPYGVEWDIAQNMIDEKLIFEAGADAMLEGLRKMGNSPKELLGLQHLFTNHRVVFIPEE